MPCAAVILAVLAVAAEGLDLHRPRQAVDAASQDANVSSVALGLKQAPAQGCSCRSVNAYVQHKPPEAVADIGQALPDCFPETAVGATTFVMPESTIENCLLTNGFGAESEANKLKCLAPDGVVGTKTAPAYYLLGDSHSVFLREAFASATTQSVFSASWWGSTNPGKVADVKDVLEKVVQSKDVIALAMRWDSRSLESYMEDVQLLKDLAGEKGAYLVLFEDNPILKSQPSACYMHAAKGAYPTACGKTLAEVQSQYKAHNDAIAALVQSSKGVYYFPMVAILCDDTKAICDYNVPGSWAPAFRDDNHLSADGAHYVSPFLCSFLKAHGLDVGGLH